MATKVGNIRGPTGVAGLNAFNITSGSFTVPNVGSTVTVTLNDASWVVVGQFLYVDQAAGGVGQAGLLQVTAKSGNQLTLLNPPIPPAIPLVSATQSGLMATLPNTGKAYFRDDGTYLLPGGYYGTDVAHSSAYTATVASDFVLQPGVIVSVTPNLSLSGANPTLNVNGTGALPLVNRAGMALLNIYEIPASRTFTAVYDGTSWRIISPLQRQALYSNVVNPVVECAGFDSVSVYCSVTVAAGQGINLKHLGYGVPVQVTIYNGLASGNAYYIAATDPSGNNASVYWIWSNTTTAGAQLVSLTTSTTQNASCLLLYNGMMSQGPNLFFL